MVQPNSQYGNSIYFPYAAGSLISYAFKDENIRENYEFKGFIYKKNDINDAIKQFDSPFIIGFSCYVWNYEYNKVLAKRIKSVFPDCIIVFGGHQINAESSVVSSNYVDYVLLGEGEESFKNLLLSLIGQDRRENISDCFYKDNGTIIRTPHKNTVIPERVSPYIEGYFDDIIEIEKLEFSAILETNRGCPNKCAFCDWGNEKAKVKQYDIELIKAEIDWMSEHKIEYCYCADANFGLFSRDEHIVDYIIKKHNETGYPQKFQATYSKNNPETVFDINKKLNESGMSKGATLSFQSMDQNVLDNIYRKNMPLESFHKLMNLYNSNGIATYSELILGLPGETYESFKEGIEKLLECGQHMSINFFNCELLKNSIMNSSEYLNKFNIKSSKTQQHQYHVVPKNNAVPEFSRIVVSTSTMPSYMWKASNIFSVYVRAFHNLGLLQCIAIFLYKEKHIKYSDFYEDLICWSQKHPDSICGHIYLWLNEKYDQVINNGGSLTCVEPTFGNLTWPLDEGAFLKVIEKYDLFYKEIEPFLMSYFDNLLLFKELLLYQKSVVKNPYYSNLKLSFNYDFSNYFSDIYKGNAATLENRANSILIDLSDIPTDLAEYAKKTIWYGRKGGQNIVTKISYIQNIDEGS